jgi:plasmid stabilization system protein ParE
MYIAPGGKSFTAITRIIYRIDENRVTVLRVIHAARLLSRGFFERLAKQSSKE